MFPYLWNVRLPATLRKAHMIGCSKIEKVVIQWPSQSRE